MIWVLGSIIIWRAKRFHISATYVVSFFVLAFVRSWITGHPWQAYSMVSANSTRMQAGKVIEIDCLDASGNDITI